MKYGENVECSRDRNPAIYTILEITHYLKNME